MCLVVPQVYALLHRREVVDACRAFGEDAVRAVTAKLEHFSRVVDGAMEADQGAVWGEDDVMGLLRQACHQWRDTAAGVGYTIVQS